MQLEPRQNDEETQNSFLVPELEQARRVCVPSLGQSVEISM